MTLALLAMSHSPLLEHAELDAEVSARAGGRVRRGSPVRARVRPGRHRQLRTGSLQRLLLPADAAVLHRLRGREHRRLRQPSRPARRPRGRRPGVGRGRDRRRDRPGRVAGHAGRPRRGAADGDPLRRHPGETVRPDLHQLGRTAVHADPADPTARRGDRPPPRRRWTARSCSSRPAVCRTTRPCRGWPPPPPISDAC